VSRDRGVRLQNSLAAYLRSWWPLAESAGSGRNGTDVLNTPGIVWENKTAREFRPAEFVRQAVQCAARSAGEVPVTVYYPDGCGGQVTADVLAIVPLRVMVGLLIDAGYGPSLTSETRHGSS
jgi:hypothetical protein